MGDMRKFLAALVTGLVGFATLVVNSEPHDITSSEWIVLATSAAAAFLVWLLPNDASA